MKGKKSFHIIVYTSCLGSSYNVANIYLLQLQAEI